MTRSDNSCVIVEIEDIGKGISEDIQACFFDPFFTAKPPGQGTGLGINVSHNIVLQKHNGRLRTTHNLEIHDSKSGHLFTLNRVVEGAALAFLLIPLWRLFEALGGKNCPGNPFYY